MANRTLTNTDYDRSLAGKSTRRRRVVTLRQLYDAINDTYMTGPAVIVTGDVDRELRRYAMAALKVMQRAAP